MLESSHSRMARSARACQHARMKKAQLTITLAELQANARLSFGGFGQIEGSDCNVRRSREKR